MATAIAAPSAPQTEMLPISKIAPTPDNTRIINETSPKFLELVESIKTHGVLQPVLCRPHPKTKGSFELRAGERRYRAAKAAGLKYVLSIVRTMTDEQAFDVTVIENAQREDLHPLEEARAVEMMLARCWTAQGIAERLGKPLHWVLSRAKVAQLIEPWRKLIFAGDEPLPWSSAHLELIARLPEAQQKRLHGELKDFHDLRGLTARQLSERIGRSLNVLSCAPWKLGDDGLIPKCGACSTCDRRSSVQPELFEDLRKGKKGDAGDTCLDEGCWNDKLIAHLKARLAELKTEVRGLKVVTMEHLSDWKPIEKLIGKEFKPDCTPDWEYKRSKEGTDGAFPAFVVHGKGQGDLVWLRNQSTREPGSGGAGQKSMKEKREGLQKKRLKRACELVLAMIDQHVDRNPEQNKLSAIDLAAAIQPHREEYLPASLALIVEQGCDGATGGYLNADAIADAMKKWSVGGGIDSRVMQISLIQRAMDFLGDGLADQIRYNVDGAAKLAEQICLAFGWLWSEYRQQGIDACPVPKSWAAQEVAEKAAGKASGKGKKKAAKPVKPAAKKGRKEKAPDPELDGDDDELGDDDLDDAGDGE